MPWAARPGASETHGSNRSPSSGLHCAGLGGSGVAGEVNDRNAVDETCGWRSAVSKRRRPMVVAERYLQRLKRRIAKASDAKKRVGFGTIAALIGGVVGPYGNVCWSILIVGDCFERGSMASLVGAGGYVNRCVNDIRRRPSQPLIQWRFHPHTVHRDRRLRSTQGPSDA